MKKAEVEQIDLEIYHDVGSNDDAYYAALDNLVLYIVLDKGKHSSAAKEKLNKQAQRFIDGPLNRPKAETIAAMNDYFGWRLGE